MTTKTSSPSTDQQTHFNWGFWNGVDDNTKGRNKKYAQGHFNNAYLQGYLAGWADAQRGDIPQTSQGAYDHAILWGDI